MTSTEATVKIGPIQLGQGVTRFNFWSFMYASFICIGVLAGMTLLLIGIIGGDSDAPFIYFQF